MSHYLVYWQTYWDEMTEGYKPGPQYNPDSEMMYKTVKRGDWLWVVILGGIHTENEWRLIERINNPGLKPVKIIMPLELVVRSSCRKVQ